MSRNNDNNSKLNLVLTDLIDYFAIDDAELARRTNIPATSIFRLKNDQNTNPTINTLKPIARFFGVTVGQLTGLEELKIDSLSLQGYQNGNYVGNITNKNSMLPLIAWEDIGIWHHTAKDRMRSESIKNDTDHNVVNGTNDSNDFNSSHNANSYDITRNLTSYNQTTEMQNVNDVTYSSAINSVDNLTKTSKNYQDRRIDYIRHKNKSRFLDLATVSSELPLSPYAFASQLKHDVYKPVIYSNAVLVVDSQHTYVNGSIVMFNDQNMQDVYLKRVIKEGNLLFLQSISSTNSIIPFDQNDDLMHSLVGVVVEVRYKP